MKEVCVKDKIFVDFISKEELDGIVKNIADKLNSKFKDKEPIFIVMLNGAFIFAADLLRQLDKPNQTIFVRYSSYEGMHSTGHIKTSSIPENVRGRDVVIIEDIVDTGKTMKKFREELDKMMPESVTLVALLSKPSCRETKVNIDILGKEIEDKFVVGYGLDYDGFGRNLDHIYKLKE